MSTETRNILEYIVACISEFANRHGLAQNKAYQYLRKYKGIQFLLEFYDVEHTLSFDEAVDDLTNILFTKGGLCITSEKLGSCMSDQQQEMLEYTTQDLIAFLMEDLNLPMETAMDRVYSSNVFSKLSDPMTGLYLQGSAYVYDLLKRELA